MEHPTAAETATNASTDLGPPTGWTAVKQKIVSCFWEVEEHLADMFGLNDSKYQFAIDEYMQKKQEEEDRAEFEEWERQQEEEKENERLAAEADALEGGGDGFEEVRLTSDAGKEEGIISDLTSLRVPYSLSCQCSILQIQRSTRQ